MLAVVNAREIVVSTTFERSVNHMDLPQIPGFQVSAPVLLSMTA